MTSNRQRIELGEYQRERQPTSPPTDADLRLAEHLTKGDNPRLEVRWLNNGDIDITAGPWVGVVRFTAVDVHIVPKYVGGALRLLKMLDFTQSTNIVRELENQRPLAGGGEHLPELLCRLLARSAHALLRQGLLRNYRPASDELAVLRGRLDYRAQLLRRYGQIDRLHCLFDEHDADNAENQFVSAALAAARSLTYDSVLRSDLARLQHTFAEACTPPTFDPSWYRQRITYSRLNTRYRTAHELAYLVLTHSAFDDIFDTTGRLHVSSFMLNMNKLFEDFATRLLQEAHRGTAVRISAHERLRTTIIDAAMGTTHSAIDPDLVVRSAGSESATPVDIKYKRYADRKLSTGDLYQAFTYALAFNDGSADARACLIYTGDRTEVTTRLLLKGYSGQPHAHLSAASIDVVDVLEQIDRVGQLSSDLAERIRRIVGDLTWRPASEVQLVGAALAAERS